MTTAAKPKEARRSARRPGPLQGTSEARQRAAAILEVLAGVRTPADAAAAMGTSVPRYYLVEQRAMQGMLAACEPRPKGRQADEGRRIAELERTVARLQRECLRQQALVRAGQRAIGLSVPPPIKPAAGAKSPPKAGAKTKPGAEAERATAMAASHLIDERIRSLGGWRAEALAEIRRLIHEADPDIVEECKWIKPTNPLGVPVWSHAGIVCTGEAYKQVVKLTFARGASLADPRGLFNSSLEGNTRRAIDIREGEVLDAEAFKALIQAAVAENLRSRGPRR